METLESPLILDELVGEEVEQLGMGRSPTHETEVAWRIDNALAKVVMPDAVCQNTRREWILRIDQPIAERLPTLGFGRVRRQLVVDSGSGGYALLIRQADLRDFAEHI